MQVYIHIPFCSKKCRYCSFISFPGRENEAEEYIGLILREAAIRSGEFDEPLRTLYIGGGTPSLLPAPLLARLISGLFSVFPSAGLSEFTVEANPGTVSKQWLDTAAGLGVNRISFGMQAFLPEHLSTLGRIHSFGEVCQCVELARSSGIRNINLDLIFGIPGQTPDQWQETLEAALSLGPYHISAYGLIPEEGTPLFEDLRTGVLTLPDPEAERTMYDDTIRLLSAHGFEQYEVSNFSLPGYECLHNIGYWTQVPYVGLGVSAASMRILSSGEHGMVCLRRNNPDSLSGYKAMILAGEDPDAVETILPAETRFETMMLGLRMNRGVSEDRFMNLHGIPLEKAFGQKLLQLEKGGLLTHADGCWKMTRRGFDIQNSILVELMDD